MFMYLLFPPLLSHTHTYTHTQYEMRQDGTETAVELIIVQYAFEMQCQQKKVLINKYRL